MTDERAEVEALEACLTAHPVPMIERRTLNIDPEIYFACVGRPVESIGTRVALERIERPGVVLGNLTYAH